jgi:flagellar assembly factor FliW
MKVAECPKPVAETAQTGTPIRLPLGLLGIEHIKEYVLVSNPGEEPFLWFQVQGDSNLAFLVLSPFAVEPTYSPDISNDDAAFLGLKDPSDALLFNIVTMRGAQTATVNLKGPIVLNRHTLVGKQVIPLNAAEFSVQHPLPTAAA